MTKKTHNVPSLRTDISDKLNDAWDATKRHRTEIAVSAAVVAATTVLVHVAHKNLEHATEVETVPSIGEEHKYFQLGETFTVGDKEVTIHNLTDAARLADATHPEDIPLTIDMLEKQIPDGMTDRTISPEVSFRLPTTAEIGHTYYPE